MQGYAEGANMGEELVLSRNRFILRLLKQNFAHVDGPRFEGFDSGSVRYEVGRPVGDLWDRNRVRIAFGQRFLREPANDFARVALQVLREAKGMLHGTGSRMGPYAETEGYDGNVRIEYA
jgi:hypothetical protein